MSTVSYDFNFTYHANKADVTVLLRLVSFPIANLPIQDCTQWCKNCSSYYHSDPSQCRKPGGGCPPNVKNLNPEDFSHVYLIGGKFDGSLYPEKVKKNAGQMFRTLNYLSSPFMIKIINKIRPNFESLRPLGLGSCWACRPKGCSVKLGNPCAKPKMRIASLEAVGVRADMVLFNMFPDFTWKRGSNMFRLIGFLQPNNAELDANSVGLKMVETLSLHVSEMDPHASIAESSFDSCWDEGVRTRFNNLYSGKDRSAIENG